MEIILQIAVLIFSVVIHEVAHGWSAYMLGDPTAKYAGRLTLNPIKHLDLWGSFLVPLVLVVSGAGVVFGWAKPVPYNPFNLKNQRWGPAVVGVAGPLSNLALALIAGVGMRAMFVTGNTENMLYVLLTTVVFINILLLVFNMLPIPPLDGSKLLFSVLPISERTKMTLEQYGFVILLAFLFLFGAVIRPIVMFVLDAFLNLVVFS